MTHVRLLPSGCQQIKKESTAFPDHKSNLTELPKYKSSLYQYIATKAFSAARLLASRNIVSRRTRVVNGPTRSGPNQARTRPEPENNLKL